MLLEQFANLPGLQQMRSWVSRAEAWWFDVTRHVRTSGGASLAGLTLVGRTNDCFPYLPSRAATARLALDQLPIRDHREYTFIDFGSGKGKVLFLAAQYPFRRIQGVEFAAELHRQAVENICRYRCRKQACTRIQSVNMNAADYQFPNENMVLYFFNPFGPEVMKTVLSNLEASLKEHQRDVFLVLMFPDLATLVKASSQLRPLRENRRYCIYRASAFC